MVKGKIVTGDFTRKKEPDDSYTRWYRYNVAEQIDIVWCSDPGRGWRAVDFKNDKNTKEYTSRSELTADLDNGTVEWL